MKLLNLKVRNPIELIQQENLTGHHERDEYIKWLQSRDTKYHLTLTMSHGTSERNAIALMNDLIKKLNSKIFKKRYTFHQSACLLGFTVMEDTSKMESVHFHILIWESPYIPGKEKLEALIESILSAGKKHGRDRIGKFKVDSYYLSVNTSIEKYVTKVFEWYGNPQAARDRFGFLGPNKIEFGGIDSRSKYGGGSSRYIPRYTAAA